MSAMSRTSGRTELAPGDPYAEAIVAEWQAKAAHFLASPSSPLRGLGRGRDVLDYFPVDKQYRILVPRIRRPPTDAPSVALRTSDGQTRIARRVAFLDFALAGRQLTLTGFRMGPTGPRSVFVPFADATSGGETYRSGRYLDLEMGLDGSVVLDFNLAYHPYCAYSAAYSCPLTPPENRLPMSILAGERLRAP